MLRRSLERGETAHRPAKGRSIGIARSTEPVLPACATFEARGLRHARTYGFGDQVVAAHMVPFLLFFGLLRWDTLRDRFLEPGLGAGSTTYG